MASEEEDRDGANIVYKMKVVQFIDRSVPIILQNDNGPCPLLAISNVLLLRNNVSLSLDMLEISQRELMSLVAEWLLDANSNIQNKDDEFVKNQQQNIGDAIQLLPRLATGIDVNVRFRHIHDFEYTPECAIFDLFHVGLVHGWLCDPQDEVTFRVIGSNSYNTLVEKLVALHASRAVESSPGMTMEEESTVDFAAATVAALGIPRPTIANILTEEDFAAMNEINNKARRKGDDEEAAELLQALQLSQTGNEGLVKGDEVLIGLPSFDSPARFENGTPKVEFSSAMRVNKDEDESLAAENAVIATLPTDKGIPELVITSMVLAEKEGIDSPIVTEEVLGQDFVFTAAESAEDVAIDNQDSTFSLLVKLEEENTDLGVLPEESTSSSGVHLETVSGSESHSISGTAGNESDISIFAVGEDVKTTVDPLVLDSSQVDNRNLHTSESIGSSFEHVPSREDKLLTDTEEAEDYAGLGLEDDEPLHEGERSLSESGTPTSVVDKEPLYEGENILTRQAHSQESGNGNTQHVNQMLGEENLSVAVTEGLIVENFLSSTASQLTYHGLFSLQDGLKNNELYVFFRNNHFSTLYKYDGQVYLLATDQGYLAQPDLVWEKLTEVDGDTVFATGTFNQFKVDQSNNGVWNEHEAVAATADFMSSQHLAGQGLEGTSYNSDLQLAMALQQQELAQQQQQQQARLPSAPPSRSSQPSAKTSTIGASRLVTGPARSTVPPPKQEKAKEKCTIM